MDLLKCNLCSLLKPESDFHRTTSKRGFTTYCKPCRASRRSVEGEMLRNARARSKARGFEFDLTLDALTRLRDAQGNRCVYCDEELDWVPGGLGKQRMCPPNRASLDRIDSSKGYTEGNVQLVTDFCNRIKTWYPHGDIVEFCHRVAAKFPATR